MKKLEILIVVLVIIILTLAGCGNNEDRVIENPEFSSKNEPLLNESLQEFSFDIFKEVNESYNDENVFISPYSIAVALGMTYNGAANETKADMAKVLHMEDISDINFNEGHKYLYNYLNDLSGVSLNTANALWIRDDITIKPEFIHKNKEVFDAYVEQLDFNKASAPNKMNEWIEDKTNGLITNMIDSPIQEDSEMFLANTIYFYGEWVNDFETRRNRQAAFYNSDGSETVMTMMFQSADFLYTSQEDYKIVKLPYEGDNISMYGLLPEGESTIQDLIESLDINQWNNMKKELNLTHKVKLLLPKFELETKKIELKEPLINLGMASSFDETNADFSNIKESLYISGIYHKAIIKIDETGTEAAAATVEEAKCEEMQEVISEFYADRPFIIIIEDKETNTILFLGKIEKF